MSNERTNKEWIDDNNLKIDEIKTIAQNLPDYQGIEPIYSNADVIYHNTNLTFNDCRYGMISYIDNYFTHKDWAQYNVYLRVIENGSSQILKQWECRNYRKNIVLLDKIGNKLFYANIPGLYYSSFSIFSYDLDSGEEEEYMTVTPPTRQNNYYFTYTNFVKPGVLCHADSGVCFIYIDLENKTTTFKEINYGSGLINPNVLTISYPSNTIYFMDLELQHTYSSGQNVQFVDETNSYICINGNLYELNGDGTPGEMITENFVNQTSGIVYYMGNGYYFFDKSLYYYNIDTKTLQEICSVNEVYHQSSLVHSWHDGSVFHYATFENQSVPIGIKVGDTNYYTYTNTGAKSSKVVSGVTVYDKNLNAYTGNMTNNGQLNYTPTTSQQTIPEGYTSGGTITAVTSAIDNNIQAENIKKDVEILGVTGTYEGSGGGSGSVKLFSTVADMEADTTAQEGDLAVVYVEDTIVEPAVYEFEGFYRYDGSQWIKLSIQGYYEIETNE